MKSRHVVCLFSVLMFAIVLIGLAAAQSSHSVPAKKLAGPFAAAVNYSSGGTGAGSLAIADLNGDGKLDLAVANPDSDTVGVVLGNGDGTFQSAVTYSAGGTEPLSIAIADVNGDQIPDLVVTVYCPTGGNCKHGGVNVLLGNGDGTFQDPVTYNPGGFYPASVAVADLNGDGHPDLVVANYCSSSQGCSHGTVGVLLGKGDGTFHSPGIHTTNAEATSVVITDINGDGHPDLVVAVQNQTVTTMLGNGDGTFQPPIISNSGEVEARALAIGDVNGDGKLDLAVAGTGLSVLLGNGDGTFESPVSYDPGGAGLNGVATGDVNGDGFLDLVVAECDSNSCTSFGLVGVLLGNGDGTFQSAVTYYTEGGYSPSVAVADLNSDHKLDAVATNSSGPNLAVFLNDSVPASTTTTITSSPNPSEVDQSVTFIATIGSDTAVPNGSVVTFSHDKTTLGTSTTTNGIASFTTSFPKPYKYSIKASYAGDVFHKASSGTMTQNVSR